MWFNVDMRVEGTSDSDASREEVFAALKDEIFKLEITLDDGTPVSITHLQPKD